MDNWANIRWQAADSLIQYRIYQFGVCTDADFPHNRHPIEAVYYRRKIYLTSWDGKLCYISQPLNVRPRSVKISFDEIRYCRACLVQIRTVFLSLHGDYCEPVLAHNTEYNFLRNHAPNTCNLNFNATVAVTPFFPLWNTSATAV